MTHCHEPHAENPNAGERWLHKAELLALLVMAGFLGYASITGRVERFVAQSYTWMAPAAAVLLALMALARWQRGRRSGHADHDSCGCHEPEHDHAEASSCGEPGCSCEGHGSHPARWLLTAALIVPVAMALAVDPEQFSSQGNRKRRLAAAPRDAQLERAIDWVLGRSAQAADSARSVDVPADPTVLQLVQAGDTGQGEAWAGHFVTVIGQCDVLGDAATAFELCRLVVTCCVADSQSVGVMVLSPAKVRVEPQQWVRVSGVLKWDAAAARLVIQAASVVPIPVPAMPYL